MPIQTPLPIPDHYTPQSVSGLWPVPYQERAAQAESWARTHGIRAAVDDEARIALLLVDVQNTFCLPDHPMYVAGRSGTGAVDDNCRLCEFIYHNLGNITRVVATLDTHQAMQIFHSLYLIDAQGKHPEPFTQVTADDIEAGKWRFNPEVAASIGVTPEYGQAHLRHYTASLKQGGKYALTIWPYHAVLGGVGHALVPAVEEAVFFHTVARRSQARFQIKGDNPLTESYSVLGPEVRSGPDDSEVGTKNADLIEQLLAFDAVIVAGQAKSHCVAWTVEDLLRAIKEREPRFAEKVYLLEDCASPVVIPGVVDYTQEAEAAYERFAAAGMHRVTSSEAMNQWPGM